MHHQGPQLIHHYLEASAARTPHRCALVHDRRRATYAELDSAAGNVAWWLHEQGVGVGDRVVLLLGNSLEYVACYYGILKAGGVAVPLNPELKPAGLLPLLAELEPRVVMLPSRRLGGIGCRDFAAHGVTALLHVGQAATPWESGRLRVSPWQEVANGFHAAPRVAVAATDLASIIYTSGSTGSPKGVMLSHRNIDANTDSIVAYLQLTGEDVQMVVLPFFYVMGKSLLNTHFKVGGRVVINNRFAFAADVLRQMVEEEVTGFSGVPSTYAHLLHKSPLAAYRGRLTSLRYCSQAGGHMARSVKEELLRVLPETTRLYVMYGATEASARLAYVEPHRLQDKLDSIGRPIPDVVMKVIGPQGDDLPCGEVGELVARGANITTGYWRNPEATAAALSEHGYHTGDLGYRDADGYFYLTGRRDHQLKVAGHRINPLEIEDALLATGLCVEAVVLGLDDPLQGKRLAALVVPRNRECAEQEVLRQCSLRLPRYKLPGALACVASLAKSPSGKIDREACLQQALGFFGAAGPATPDMKRTADGQ